MGSELRKEGVQYFEAVYQADGGGHHNTDC